MENIKKPLTFLLNFFCKLKSVKLNSMGKINPAKIEELFFVC